MDERHPQVLCDRAAAVPLFQNLHNPIRGLIYRINEKLYYVTRRIRLAVNRRLAGLRLVEAID
jgi:hypothetical protein